MARLGWWGGLLAGLVALVAAGHGELGVDSVGELGHLASGAGPVVAAIAALRLVALAGGLYLLGLSLLAEAVRLPGVGALARPLARLPLPGGRGLVWRAIGIGWLVAGPAAGVGGVASATPVGGPGPAPVMSTAAPAGGPAAVAPVMHWVAPSVGPSTPTPTVPPSSAVPPSSVAPLSSAAPSASAVPPSSLPSSTVAPPSTVAPSGATALPFAVALPSAAVPYEAAAHPSGAGTLPTTPGGGAGPTPATTASGGLPPRPRPAATPPGATRVLDAGDSLWSVAAATVAAAVPHPDAALVARYWVAVVAANRSRLPNPADPSFVLPGLVVSLPPLPPPPA